MKIYSGAVIVWNNKGEGKVFNDIETADEYFCKQARAKKMPQWERLFAPIYKQNGVIRFGGK